MFGGGHAATIAVRATRKGFLKPKAIAAVAPTWAGPLPIVFGKDSNMETRYGLDIHLSSLLITYQVIVHTMVKDSVYQELKIFKSFID